MSILSNDESVREKEGGGGRIIGLSDDHGRPRGLFGMGSKDRGRRTSPMFADRQWACLAPTSYAPPLTRTITRRRFTVTDTV